MESKTNDIFSYFNEKALDPSKIRVIGVDFGDGELAISYSELDSMTREQTVKHLPINNMNSVEYAILYYGKGDRKDNDVVEIGRTGGMKKGGKLYTNYKVLPSRAKETYNMKTSGGKISLGNANPSYQDLMGRAFAKLIEDVVDNNKSNIEDINDIYLFVGRPSSTNWAKEAKEYRDILRSKLKKDKNYHVFVISEALAAMANEYRKNRSLSGKTVVIIDGGSSTFDCAVVKGGRILCEYSRQIGAGMLDKNLLDLYVFGAEQIRKKGANGRVMSWNERQRKRKEDFERRDRNNKPLYSYSEGRYLIDMRSEKEDYYGPDGNAEDETVTYYLPRTIEEEPGSLEYYKRMERQNATIKSLIDVAVNEMPVLVKSSYPQEENDEEHCGEDYEYGSFAEGVESFFRGAKVKWEEKGAKPEVVIVTGGATYMPFVGELMNKVFEPEKNGIEVVDEKLGDRHYSVADGVAYMGYLELYKEQVYREVCSQIGGILKKDSYNINNLLCDSYEKYEWEMRKKSIKKWKNTPDYKTLNDWYVRPDLPCVPGESHDINYFEHKYPMHIVVWMRESWSDRLKKVMEHHLNASNGIVDNINHILSEKTKELFGQGHKAPIDIKAEDLSNVGEYFHAVSFPADRYFYGNRIRNWWQGLPRDMSPYTALTEVQKGICVENFLKSENEVRESIREQADTYFKSEGIYDRINKALLDNAYAFVREYVDSLTEYMIMEEFNVG